MSETIMVPIQDQQSAYQRGLSEGFRRGVQAAAAVCDRVVAECDAWMEAHPELDAAHWRADGGSDGADACAAEIRALRPDGEKT